MDVIARTGVGASAPGQALASLAGATDNGVPDNSESPQIWDLAVVGAGPVGLEAAALGVEAGLGTIVLEAGEVGEHVARWGWAELFSPASMNVGPAGIRVLLDSGSAPPWHPASGPDEVHTGRQLRERFLLPLADALRSAARIRDRTEVLAISRTSFLKGDEIASPRRRAEPFRLLVRQSDDEYVVTARAVFDCSGTYGRPAWAGPGGAPAVGERSVSDAIIRHLPDPLGSDKVRFAGRRTLVLGDGHSAATTVLALSRLAEQEPGTAFVWATRGERPVPLVEFPGDPLPGRAGLASRANRLAANPPTGSEWIRGATLEAVRRTRPPPGSGAARIEARLSVSGAPRCESFDKVVANVGYEPDNSLYRQLQVHECYATLGPMNTSAARMGAAGTEDGSEAAGSGNCLAAGPVEADSLVNPEPDFFVLGVKSYGKNPDFLMRTGYQQAAQAVAAVTRVLHPAVGGSAPAFAR